MVGDVEAAAAVLERASESRPANLELRAMLARTYIDAEDATAAERATESLVEADPSSFPLIFEVARLYLQRSYVSEAVRVLTRAVEPALTGRQEAALHDILNEALARDPEHIEALKLLLRIYTWQRDDERSHVTLERLAEAAQTHGLRDEERRALEHLVRLVPFDQSYHERLDALGGPRPAGERDEADDELPSHAPQPEAPVFEVAGSKSFDFDPFAAAPPSAVAAPAVGSEFEWNDVAEIKDAGGADTFAAAPAAEFAPAEFTAADFAPTALDPASSFADLNEDPARRAASFADLNEEPARAATPAPLPEAADTFDLSFGQPAHPASEPAAFDPQEVHFADAFGDLSFGAADAAPDAGAPRRTYARGVGRAEAQVAERVGEMNFLRDRRRPARRPGGRAARRRGRRCRLLQAAARAWRRGRALRSGLQKRQRGGPGLRSGLRRRRPGRGQWKRRR